MEWYPVREETKQQIQHIIDKSSNSIALSVYGKSGTGKTCIVKESLNKYFSQKKDITIVYLDLLDDILSTTAFWDLLIFMTWNGEISSFENILQISKKTSFSHFLSKNKLSKLVFRTLINSVSATVANIPYYNAQIELGKIDFSNIQINNSIENDLEKSQIVMKYLKYITKKRKLILVVDNYQFMNSIIKSFFETSINKIQNNLIFINIQRTDMCEFLIPNTFKTNHHEIEITNINKSDLEIIINKKFPDLKIIKDVIDDCFEKTNGNFKEIDIYIRTNSQLIEKGVIRKRTTRTLSQSINHLPPIQRDLVLLATLFPAGIRLEYVTTLMQNIFVLNNEILNDELNKIITLGYVLLNSSRKDLLKPTHDKIGLSINAFNSTEDFMDFYNSVEQGLEQIIKNKKGSSDYIYLLHCYIGICDSKRLLKEINYLEDLITLEYNNCSYIYLVELTSEYLCSSEEIINHLAQKSVLKLLDSCQKTCSFNISLKILEILKGKHEYSEIYSLFNVKVLTQLYKFSEALEEAKRLPKNNESFLCVLNILEHLGKDEKIITLLENFFNKEDIIHDKWYYLILRNTTHFFEFNKAEENLLESLNYFEKCGTCFEQATIYNNLSVIQIWNGKETFNKAEINIKNAIKILKNIGSNEIFEPYYNYGTLEYLKGNYKKAIKYYDLAAIYVPETLSMDVTLIELNKKICECAQKSKNIDTLEIFLLQCLNKREILQDPWVRFQIEYNLRNIEILKRKKSDISPNQYYINSIHNFTAMTVFTILELQNQKLSICLSLSPNWRY